MREKIKKKLMSVLFTAIAVKEIIVTGYTVYRTERKAKYGKKGKNESRET
jgi:hypothetical protein